MSIIRDIFTVYIQRKPVNKKLSITINSAEDIHNDLLNLTRELRIKDEALQASKVKYHRMYTLIATVLDSMPGIVWAKDLEGRFILTNKKLRDELLGSCSIDDAIGHTAEHFANKLNKGDTLHKDCRRTDSIVIETKTNGNFIERGVVNGDKVIVRTSKAPLFDKNGKLVGTVGFGRDISKECNTAFAVLSNVEKTSETCPRQCIYSSDMEGLFTETMGLLHSIIATTCDLKGDGDD